MAAGEREDWAEVLERLGEGDKRALLKLTRLINGFLVRWNAYDFRDDWEDLVQEILMAGLRAHEGNRIRDRAHTYGFLKTVARNKFVDHLRAQLRMPEDTRLPWEEALDAELDEGSTGSGGELSRDLQQAVDSLDDRRRRSILAVYVEGRTLAEAADSTEIPMGSLRRYLREGLSELRQALALGPDLSPNRGAIRKEVSTP